ncbi:MULTISPECIES: oxalate/formate MFS antiporter [unclassified Methylobacterium]|jgi:OFA family oxalate/formate antiporter-like MFS transporter|uniref:oxalate/formate MFS antiporter n=1 Tax=unclassified Methylobacterium TaxID=2615210 RepID=UPI0006F2A819|nr:MULTISPECIES: oxalate/formate MFS antiporter [unclassified Methylobacterium]KQO67331.1 oxalate/formate MFS antiporter [Methylobacterium sp. Leaf89]KQO74136.1 oxalate/formate MFS antiporter [Methylobacterium sp. Leaf88]KQT84785.1 oxalate/formate MFS antiporter [Methylobacterium sp. Leaf465]
MDTTLSRQRWLQLGLGLIAMMAISSPQYVWTLFTKPLIATTGSTLPQIQWTFTILIVLQTFFSPVQGYLIDRFSPKLMIALGAALSGLGWVLAARVDTLLGVYATYGLFCGLGTGIVYVGIVGLMVKWFPDRRGFAVGVVAAGYGMGAMLSTFPISDMLTASGYRHTLTVFGIVLGAIGALAALGLRAPRAGEVLPPPAVNLSTCVHDTPPRVMLRTPLFWLMFVMMTMMSTGGLMVVANFASFARDFGVADAIIFGFVALPFALTFDRITNGLTRPFFGWVSDKIGRENTMGIAFAAEAVAIALLLVFRENAYAFALLSGVVFFAWGEIFSLFPSILTDTFGTKHATTNYGFLYMAQGIGSLFGGPIAAWIYAVQGSWLPVFAIIITLDVLTAILAYFVLKPMRRRWLDGSVEPVLVGKPAMA